MKENYYDIVLKFAKENMLGNQIAPVNINKQLNLSKGVLFATDFGRLIQIKPLKNGNHKIILRSQGCISGGNLGNAKAKNQYGYWMVRINNNLYYLHRVIFEAFWGEELKRSDIISHKDNNKLNANLNNLKLSTKKQNTRDFINDFQKFVLDNHLSELKFSEKRKLFFDSIYSN